MNWSRRVINHTYCAASSIFGSPRKMRPKYFYNISYKTSAILVKAFLLKEFAAKSLNNFHLTWIMSLHYLMKLEMLIEDVLPLSCYRKKLQNLSHLICGLQIRHIWIQLITAWEMLQERVYKTGITDLELSTTPLTNGCRSEDWRCDPAWPTLFSVAVSVCSDQWCVICTLSHAIDPTRCNQLYTNLANLKATDDVG